MGAPPPNGRLQQLLQSAVQAVDWTYSIFWQFCPQQGVLVWSEGYYNGAIKTRKTVQPMEVSAEEASLQRSQQLRELYDTLSAGETNHPVPVRRAALSPEDLTESEWFYLMCVSFSFSPGTGLPGKAYAKRQYVWLTGAHELDSKVFSRAILAKSARIQTVLCIPLMDGVVELGSTERIQEDPCLIPHVKTFFVDHRHPPPKPALSGHSTSNPAASSSDHPPPIPAASMYHATTEPTGTSNPNRVNHQADDDEEDEDEDDEDVTNAEGSGAESDSEAETGRNSRQTSEAGPLNPAQLAHTTAAEPSELMQLEMSEDIRMGSPDDASNHMDSDFPAVVGGGVGAGVNNPADAFPGHRTRAESSRRWPVLLQHQSVQPPPQPPLSTDAPPFEELAQDDTHYSQTVSSVLQHQATRWTSESYPATAGYLGGPTTHSAFSKWTFRSDHHLHVPPERSSQWLLKYILLTVPYLHIKYNGENSPKTQGGPGSTDQTSRFRTKGAAPQDELSANHVLAERRRREKLNERFIILRSLVPFVTKMDKASILGDTIEYLKQLRRKIQDLEAGSRQIETERARLVEAAKSNSSGKDPQSAVTLADRARNGPGPGSDKRKVRVVEGSSGGAKAKMVESPPMPADMLQVSIIESDALIELQCPYKEGVLLELMLTLREMLVEVTAVQSSLNNGFFTAELRAKVKENVNGKKASIIEVKRAINQIVPHTHDS